MTFDASERAVLREARAIRDRANKAAKAARPKSPKADRGRVRDNPYLAWIRRLPCAARHTGECVGAVQACHVRMSVPGRPNPGLQRKADDRLTWPGCAHHHLDDQHKGSERAFWDRLGIDPFALTTALSAAYDAGTDGAAVVRGFQTRRAVP